MVPGIMLRCALLNLTAKHKISNGHIRSCVNLNSPVHRKTKAAILSENEKKQKALLREEISKCFSNEHWEILSKKLVNREIKIIGSHVNEANVESFIMRQCNDLKLFEAGQLFYKYISAKNRELSSGILSQYLNLCRLDRQFALSNEQMLVRIYKKLTSVPIVEPLIGERCISAICLFENHWRDSLQLLQQVKLLADPTPESYSAIIEACFKFGEIRKGLELSHHLATSTNTKPHPNCLIAYLDYYSTQEDKYKVCDGLEELFKFLEEYHFHIPSLEVVQQLEKLIFSLSDEDYHWNIKESYVPKSGVCANCRRLLEPVKITSEEFRDMCKTFVSKAVIGTNVFLKSTPDEIKRFKNFLEKVLPFDMIIDGLNIAYATGNKSPAALSHILRTVVSHFVNRGDKVVVLGRMHMKKWPNMDYVFNNSRVFLATNLSQDDPLLLYAALRGGEKTCFISRDFMRSHIFALEDSKTKLLFRKWLISHQFRLGYFDKTGRPNILQPLPYRPTAQKLPLTTGEMCWHIPYDEEYRVAPPESREPPPKWLCIRRIPRRL